MQIGRSPVLSQKRTRRDQAGNHPFSLRRRGWALARTDGAGQPLETPRPSQFPRSRFPGSTAPTPRWEEVGRDLIPLLHPPPRRGMLVATTTRCKQQEEPNLGSTQFAASGEPAADSQIQGNSHKTQVICCNIVAGSYSRFAEIGDVLGVLGLPQSTAGRRYEISIYILQLGQESDNLMAKLRGK